jgi:hypothetical protein
MRSASAPPATPPLRPRRRGAALLLLLLLLPLTPVRADEAADAARKKESGHADLVVDRYSHDFGEVKQLESLTTSFTYTNAGSEPIHGIRVRGECGCNRMDLSHESLAPGESGTLAVEFQTGTLGGFLRKRLHLSTSDYTRGTVVIPLTVAIVKGLIVSSGGVSFRNVLVNTRPTKAFHVKWYEGAGTPFTLTSVEVPGFDFETKIRPYEPHKDPRWKGWTVDVTFQETPPLGMFSAEVRVRTTDKERPELTFALSANICGKVYMQSRYVSFGAYDKGQAKTASIKFRPFDKSIHFGEVTARSRSGALEVEAIPDPRHAEAGFYRLSVTVPADRPVGSLADEVIELHTGVPGEELILVGVKGSVREPRKKPTEDEAR